MKLHLPKKLVSTIEEYDSHILTLRTTIIILAISLLSSLYALYKAPSEIIVRIPPDLSNGAVMRIGDVPKASILTYTAYLWIEINTWLKDGQKEAFENLDLWQFYISDKFKRELTAQYNKLNSNGELNLKNIKRRVTLSPGTLSDWETRVIVRVKNRSWIVMLDVIVEDYYLGEKIQDVVVRYPLEVEIVEANSSQNPLGIQIIGLAEQAMIVKENK
ncbi:DUF2895 family protein [Vibrio metoecus]|nr:DUF2895 family protein [Vibrio cholerae]